jgi:hypothetical protein
MHLSKSAFYFNIFSYMMQEKPQKPLTGWQNRGFLGPKGAFLSQQDRFLKQKSTATIF